MQTNKDELLEKILSQFPEYKDQQEIIKQKISELAPEIETSLNQYLDTGIISGINIEGYTIQRLKEEHSMNPIAAHLTLDWLKRNPDEAKASLQKGHDSIK